MRLKGLLVGKHLAFRDTSWKTISCFFQSAPVVNALWLYFYYRYKLLFFELLLCTWQHYMPYEHYLIYSACQPSKLDKYFSILSLSQLSFWANGWLTFPLFECGWTQICVTKRLGLLHITKSYVFELLIGLNVCVQLFATFGQRISFHVICIHIS